MQSKRRQLVGMPPFTEDFNGNLTSDGDRQYKFDALNRVAQVVRVSDAAILAEFAYDGLNRRALKKAGAVTTRYLCANEDVAAEVDGEDAFQARYIVSGQPINLATGRPGPRPDTHIPLPPQ